MDIHQTIEKCERLARDKNAPPGERQAAKAKVDELRKKAAASAQGTEQEYRGLVEEAKSALQQLDLVNWKLGELADKVEAKIGEGRLKRFAEDIGVKYHTLVAYRSTFRAWPDKKVTKYVSWSVAHILNAHPDRYRIVQQHPGLTPLKAYTFMHAYSESRGTSGRAGKHNRRAERATARKKYDPSGHVRELIGTLETMFNRHGALVDSLRKVDLGGVRGAMFRKDLLKALRDLQARVGEEIVKLEAGSKLN